MTAPSGPSSPAGRPFVIVGAGGHGREVHDLAVALGRGDDIAGFVDDHEPSDLAAERIARHGATVLGDVAWLAGTDLDHVIGIGSSAARRAIAERLADSAGRSIVLVHPTADIGSHDRLSDGVVVGARSTVTTNVTLGHHTHVNVGCSVQHDSVLGDYVTLSPGVFVNGDVVIGDDVFVGTGAVITRGCTVGAGAVIGAGAVVLDDVPPGVRVFGIPARRQRS